jgi:hypothetical protein
MLRMKTPPPIGPISWTQARIADVPLNRFTGCVGPIEVGAVEFDGSNRMWVWSSPLADDAWGWASNEEGAKQALETWLRGWLENFRGFFSTPAARP